MADFSGLATLSGLGGFSPAGVLAVRTNCLLFGLGSLSLHGVASTPPSPDADLVDRRYLSQFSTEQVGLMVSNAAGPLDPYNNVITVAMTNDSLSGPEAQVFSARTADRLGVGVYASTLTSADTTAPGLYTVSFNYLLNNGATSDYYLLHLRVGTSAPAYDVLPSGMKLIVEQVWVRFADLFDSALGGPHLQTYLSTKFGRNRMAQLLSQGVGRLNTISQPYSTYSVSQNFPFTQWGPLLEQVLYVEVLKHLRRSYVEQPEVILGTTISRLDRKDYMDRWGVVLADELIDLKSMTDSFKMANMGLGNVSVLLSGGAFGRLGPVAFPGGAGQAAARGLYFGSRMY